MQALTCWDFCCISVRRLAKVTGMESKSIRLFFRKCSCTGCPSTWKPTSRCSGSDTLVSPRLHASLRSCTATSCLLLSGIRTNKQMFICGLIKHGLQRWINGQSPWGEIMILSIIVFWHVRRFGGEKLWLHSTLQVFKISLVSTWHMTWPSHYWAKQEITELDQA